MCILLYVKLIWCSGFPEIYAQLEEGVGSVCHGYMCILLYVKLDVVVLHRSMVNWSRGYLGLRYMCILLYMKLIQCSGVA